MIEILGAYLLNFDPGFNILRYLTFRTLGGTITALTLSILLGPIFINFLKIFNSLKSLERRDLNLTRKSLVLLLWVV